jgi:succinate dehydrogenase/fumarate reductase-like Fe-S protein
MIHSQFHPNPTFTYFPKFHLNVILQSPSKLTKWFLFQTSVCLPCVHILVTCPAHSSLLDFTVLTILNDLPNIKFPPTSSFVQSYNFKTISLYRCHYRTFLPAEKVAFQPLLLCKASVTNLTNISPLEAVSVIRGAVFDVKPLFGCRRNPLVLAPS